MTTRTRVAFLLFAVVLATNLWAQTWTGLRTDGPRIVDEHGNNVLLRGFGPGEWTNIEAYMIQWADCDANACATKQHNALYGATEIHLVVRDLIGDDAANQFWHTWQSNILTDADFARMHAWGANVVRISINYHWLSPADGEYLESGWQWLDRIVAWGKAHDIRIVLCLHAAPGSQSNELMADTPDPGKGIQPPVAHLWSEPEIYQPWTIHLWTKIAERYANEPQIAGYDLLDEPMPPKPELVRTFYVKLTAAIRSVDAHHIIFVEGLNYAGDVAGMQAMLPPWDNNMVLVFHKYWDKNDVASIQGYLDIREKYHVPLWNGETGENKVEWMKQMNDLLSANNIGWLSWTYKKITTSPTAPYTITAPAGYDDIKKYVECWYPGNTACSKPERADATRTLMDLAANAATEKCTYHEELVEALFGKQKNER